MSRRDRERLEDITDAITGEAIKALSSVLLASEPNVPWADIAGMRDRLAHHYFDTEHRIVAATVANDLAVLEAAIARLDAGVTDDE